MEHGAEEREEAEREGAVPPDLHGRQARTETFGFVSTADQQQGGPK